MTSPRAHVDRHLRALDHDQRDVAPRWRDLLHRVFGGDEALGTAHKADLLGIPGRRQVLRIGGMGIAGAALLAACSDDDDAAGDETLPDTTADDGDDEPVRDEDLDLVLANTAISLEVLVVDTYRFALESGLLESSVARDAAALFQGHHGEHRDALIGVVEATGGVPFTTANPVVRAAFVDPLLAAAASERDLLRLAHDLEQAAAQTYVHAATALSTADLRSTAGTIAGIESRHAAVLDLIGELSNDKPSAYGSTNPLPQDAMVTG